jgi:UDP-glucose 4-epimerase
MTQTWYAGRPVLVIGGLGFIGANLSRRLVSGGAACTVVTPLRAAHQLEAAALESSGVRIVEADVRDAAAIRDAVAGQQVVFNLAGRSGAVRSIEDPFTDLDVNCRGSLVLLEAIREVSPGAKLVFSSSRLAYGEAGEAPAGEDRGVDPRCTHAIHKLAVEQYLRMYGQLFGLRYAIARITNPYGPGQPGERTDYGVVNRMIHLALAGDAVTVYGDGRQRRDYIYIDDVVEALLLMGEQGVADGMTYNVGTGLGTPLVDMAQAIIDMAGGGRIAHVPWPTLAKQIETGDFVADISRIHAELGWQPRVALEDGLRRTVAHYREYVAS